MKPSTMCSARHSVIGDGLFRLRISMMLASGKGKSWHLNYIHMALGAATFICLLGAPIYLLATR